MARLQDPEESRIRAMTPTPLEAWTLLAGSFVVIDAVFG
jgi:hypothetical protein